MRRIETFEWWSELLAVKDDFSLRELARRFEVTPGAISAALKRTGTTRRSAPPGPRTSRRMVEGEQGEASGGAIRARSGSKDHQLMPYLEEIGQRPDREIAELAGVSTRTVASFRSRNNIAGYAGPRRRGRTTGSTDMSSEKTAWRVRVSGLAQTYVVIAPDLPRAAQLASERLGWPVIEVSLVGEVL